MNPKLTNEVNSIISSYKPPRFLIIEHMALPALDIWNKTDYKVLIHANNLESLIKRIEGRIPLGCDRNIVMNRHFGVKEYLENIDVDYIIGNDYDQKFYDDVKHVALQVL